MYAYIYINAHIYLHIYTHTFLDAAINRLCAQQVYERNRRTLLVMQNRILLLQPSKLKLGVKYGHLQVFFCVFLTQKKTKKKLTQRFAAL